MSSTARLLHDQVARGTTPAVQYRFVAPDSVLVRFDQGLADIAAGTPVSDATTYHGFSVTKTLTALAILQLAERGALRLDDPAADHLPEFPYPPDISLRHLLTHSAGIPNPVPLSWVHLAEEHATFDRDAFFRDVFTRHGSVKGPPNARFAYSNLGYVLLGQVIERVTGTVYEQYVMENVLLPAGIAPADLDFAIRPAQSAKGYHRRYSPSALLLGLFVDRSRFLGPAEQGWRPFRPYYVNGIAYGGMSGTADGFARYLQALLDPASGLLSDESRRLLFTENVLSDGTPSGMALSWFRGELDGHVYLAHAGGGGGYYAEVRVYPELRRASVILFNRSGMRDERFLDRVDREPLRAEASADRKALQPAPAAPQPGGSSPPSRGTHG
jgi:D-alanyl-D-alanine carboxypeptidase